MKTLSSIVAVLTVASAVATAEPAAALDSCSDVDVRITNEHPSGNPVKILYLKYQVNGGGSWYKEGLADHAPTSGNTVTYLNQNLQDLPVGSGALFRVYFKEQISGGLFPSYGPTRFVAFDELNPVCTDGDSYGFVIDQEGTLGT